MRGCGARRIDKEVEVGLTVSEDGAAGVDNVQFCGSRWACPVCSPRHGQERAEEIDAILTKHLQDGGGAYTFVLTFPHHLGQSLSDLWDTMTNGFRHLLSGAKWYGSRWKRKDGTYGENLGARDRFSVSGTIRAAEATWSPGHGWHPHLHPVVLTDRELTDDERAGLEHYVRSEWIRYVCEQGLGEPADWLIELREVRSAAQIADYLSKIAGVFETDGERARAVGYELARQDLKRRRGGGGFQPWGLLHMAMQVEGAIEADVALRLWHEYEQATHGRQHVTFSRGLRDLLPDEEEESPVRQTVVRPSQRDLHYILQLNLWGDLFDLIEETWKIAVSAPSDPILSSEAVGESRRIEMVQRHYRVYMQQVLDQYGVKVEARAGEACLRVRYLGEWLRGWKVVPDGGGWAVMVSVDAREARYANGYVVRDEGGEIPVCWSPRVDDLPHEIERWLITGRSMIWQIKRRAA